METGNTFLLPTCLQRRLINRSESGNGEDLLPIPTVGEPNDGHLSSALHAEGGIYEYLQHVQYYATILPQAALASTNSEAEMAELAEIRSNLQSCLRRVATLLGELEGRAEIASD